MRRSSFVASALIILGTLFLWEGAVVAGTVIDQDMIDLWGQKSGSVLFYSKKRLRVDQKDGKLSTIMDFQSDRIVILDHSSKTYIEYPFSKWGKRVSEKLGSQEQPFKRESRIEPTGDERLINGFKTRQIRVFIDGILFQENWVTQDVNLEEMLEAIRDGAGRLSGFSRAELEEKEEIYRKIKEWGFPILTTEYRKVYGKTLKEVTEIKRIETRGLNSHLFSAPKGYTKRTQ